MLYANNLPHPFDAMLLPNETLLWRGSPVQNFRFSTQFIAVVVVGIGLSVFGAWQMSDMSELYFIGIAPLLLGLYLPFGYHINDTARRKRTHYAVTSHRILIQSGVIGNRISLLIANIPELIFTPNSDNTANILFGRPTIIDYGSYKNKINPPFFEAITDGESVYQLILQQQIK